APMMYSVGMLTPGAAVTAGGGVVGRAPFADGALTGAFGWGCAAHGTAAPATASVIEAAAKGLAILFERNLAVMFSEKIQETFVVPRVHVEDARDDLVVAPRFFQALPHHLANVRARDFALHEERIHRGPERFAVLGQPLIEIVRNRTAAFTSRTETNGILR